MIKKLFLILLILGALVLPVSAGFAKVATMNINTTQGSLSNYPIKIIISNNTGTSGFYSTDNVIFTSGYTRPDWADISFTDVSNNEIPFWIENQTSTSKNITVWVNPGTIAAGNGTIIKLYFGFPTITSNAQNGENVFLLFDDFSINTLNTSKWAGSGYSISGGWLTVTGAGAYRRVRSFQTFGKNTSVRFYGAIANTYSNSDSTGIGYDSSSGTSILLSGYPANLHLNAYNYNGTTVSADLGTPSIANHLYDISRYSVGDKVVYKTDGATSATLTTGSPAVSVNITAVAYNNGVHTDLSWVIVRNFVDAEPFGSNFVVSDVFDNIIPGFSTGSSSYFVGDVVQFHDTSSGNPTAWNWSFGEGNFSTLQNPIFNFSHSGSYTVILNSSNVGSFGLVSHVINVYNQTLGHIDDFVKLAPPSQIKRIEMDPLVYDLTPPKGEVIWDVSWLVPANSQGSFIVNQRDGKITTGTWNYSQSGIFGHFSVTFGSSSSDYDYQSIVGIDQGIFEADPVILELFNSKNESGKSPGLSLGYGQLPGMYNHILSVPTNPEPMNHFSFNSNKNIIVTWFASPTQSALTTLLHAAQANEIPYVTDALQLATDLRALVYIIIYWLFFFLVSFQIGTFLLYSFGMALYSATRCNGQDMLCWWKMFLEAEANYLMFWANLIYMVIQAILKWL